MRYYFTILDFNTLLIAHTLHMTIIVGRSQAWELCHKLQSGCMIHSPPDREDNASCLAK